jgi:hypothetical protein
MNRGYMKHNKQTILSICNWLGGVPNWTDKDDPEMNEIKTWIITKQARGKIQDRLLDDGYTFSVLKIRGRIPNEDNFMLALCHDSGQGTFLTDSCHNMLWVDAAAWRVNAGTTPTVK